MRWPNENKFDGIIASVAELYHVPLPLIKAVISLESEFLPGAYRDEAPRPSLPPTPDFPAGGDRSIGLMQLLVRTARTLGYRGAVGDRRTLTGLYDPATNIALGAELLRDDVAEARRRGLGLDAAISAYNGGWRPSLGFGAKRADGKFANQAYVHVVAERYRYFGGGELAGPSSDTVPTVPLLPGVDSSAPGPEEAASTPDVPSGIAFAESAPLATPADAGGTGAALAMLGAALAVVWLVTELYSERR